MKQAVHISAGWLLIAMLMIPAVLYAQEPVRDPLFHIERSKNANIVQYDAMVRPDGTLDADEPVAAYWIRLAEQGQVKKLSWLQKKLAYGFRIEPGAEKDIVVLQMAAKIGRSIEVRKAGEDYRAVTEVEDVACFIDSIYIHSSGHGLFTRVHSIELHGTGIDDGEEHYESFAPGHLFKKHSPDRD